MVVIKVRNWLHRARSNVNSMAFRGVCRGASGAIILSMFESQARVGTRGGVRVYTSIINACMDMRVRGPRKCLRGTLNHRVAECSSESKTEDGARGVEVRQIRHRLMV